LSIFVSNHEKKRSFWVDIVDNSPILDTLGFFWGAEPPAFAPADLHAVFHEADRASAEHRR